MQNSNLKTAVFAGGCFWCMVGPFREHKGVSKVEAGYAGGTTENPTYEEVSTGQTGHIEVVQITYDPTQVSYNELLEIFWRQIDPTDEWGQFADKGSQYVTAIFYGDETEKEQAEASKKKLADSGKFKRPIATKILPPAKFYRAEEYHQNYDQKNPMHYQGYKKGSGRADFLKETWGK